MVSFQIEKKLTKAGYKTIVGVDESGRGPLAGPVVTAAVHFLQKVTIKGLDDSKKLTEEKRFSLFEKIVTHPKIIFAIEFVSPIRIDEINILRASLEGMKKAAENLALRPDAVLIDGDQSFQGDYASFPIIGGDGLSMSIAAASILAKVTRDFYLIALDRSFPEYGFKDHKGYGTKKHKQALLEYGPMFEHRTSFSCVKEASFLE